MSHFSDTFLYTGGEGGGGCELVGRGGGVMDPMVVNGEFGWELYDNEGKVCFYFVF